MYSSSFRLASLSAAGVEFFITTTYREQTTDCLFGMIAGIRRFSRGFESRGRCQNTRSQALAHSPPCRQHSPAVTRYEGRVVEVELLTIARHVAGKHDRVDRAFHPGTTTVVHGRPSTIGLDDDGKIKNHHTYSRHSFGRLYCGQTMPSAPIPRLVVTYLFAIRFMITPPRATRLIVDHDDTYPYPLPQAHE